MENTKREIRFRVWDSKAEHFWKDGSSGEDGYGWNEDWLCITMDGQVAIFDSASSVYVKSISAEQDRFVIQQFTGLKDKNGKEIYEGDILLGRFILDKVEDHIFLSLTEEEKKTQSKVFVVEDIFYPYTNQIPEDLEVIGNIYENPNLLSDTKSHNRGRAE